MKLYRVVEFNPTTGLITPVNKTLYKSSSQAKAMRTRYLQEKNRYEFAKLVFVQTSNDIEWTKHK